MTPLDLAAAEIEAAQTDVAEALGEMSPTWGSAEARKLLAQTVIYALATRGWTVERGDHR